MHKLYTSQGYKFIILSTIKNTYINRWHNFEIIFQSSEEAFWSFKSISYKMRLKLTNDALTLLYLIV